MKTILDTSQSFIASESSGESPNKYLGIITDIGIFAAYTRPQLYRYVWQCLVDVGMSIDSRGPYVLDPQEHARVTDPYAVHIVNPQNGNILIEIYGSEHFSLATLAALLSTQFSRHEVRVVENGNTVATLIAGKLRS